MPKSRGIDRRFNHNISGRSDWSSQHPERARHRRVRDRGRGRVTPTFLQSHTKGCMRERIQPFAIAYRNLVGYCLSPGAATGTIAAHITVGYVTYEKSLFCRRVCMAVPEPDGRFSCPEDYREVCLRQHRHHPLPGPVLLRVLTLYCPV